LIECWISTRSDDIANYQKAVRFANGDYHVKIEKYNQTIKDRIADEESTAQQRLPGLTPKMTLPNTLYKCVGRKAHEMFYK
jgi:hypothetical protein